MGQSTISTEQTTANMSASEPTEPKVEETKVEETKPEETKPEAAPAAEAEGSADKPVTSSSVFSMFGGGAKKEKRDEDAPESEDVHFEPVIKLTEKVETKTNEEAE